MLGTILSLTFRDARRCWRRLLGVLVAMVAAAGVAALLAGLAGLGGGSADDIALAVALLLLLASWWLVASARVVLHDDGVGDALAGGAAAAPRLLAAGVVLCALVLPLLLVLPMLVLPGAIASGQRWGVRTALRLGVAAAHRNLGAYVAVLLVVTLLLVLAAPMAAGGIVALAGVPAARDLGAVDAAIDYLATSPGALVLGVLLAMLPISLLVPPLLAATWRALEGRDAALGWAGEDLRPQDAGSELSPAVAALLGSGPAPPRRRMHVPPRAPQPGRLPGPGVLAVTDVALPPGSTTRPVDSPTLELDVADAAPAAGPGGLPGSAPHSMWVTTQPIETAPARWKQLAAGFSESGLWPLLLPVEQDAHLERWYEQRSRRERDALDATPEELFRARLHASLGHSPLSGTALIAASGVARGELGRASGRRTDALRHAFQLLGESHLALVGARRPADVVHRTAWPGTRAAEISGAELAELLASWEERYGALLVGMAESSLVFAVLRPPASLEEAIEVAAEHHATAPDEAEHWGDDRSYAQSLVEHPVWRLSWT